MTLNNSKTSSKPRPGLSRKRESQLRAFHNLTSREDLPTPFGSNPYLGQTSSNATFPWAQNRQRFYSNTHKKSVMKELNFQKLFLEGRVVELEEEAPRDGPRTGVNEEQSQAQSQTDWRRIRLEKTLSIGRASMTVLVNLPNGVQMVLKAYHKLSSTDNPVQFQKEREAYIQLSALGLTYTSEPSSEASPVSPRCYGYLEFPEMSTLEIDELAQSISSSSPTTKARTSFNQSQARANIKRLLQKCSHGLLIEFLSPSEGWRTLSEFAKEGTCKAAVKTIEAVPWLHNDAFARNVIVREMKSDSEGGMGMRIGRKCGNQEQESKEKPDYEAVWIDWASSVGLTPDSRSEFSDEGKLREMGVLWSRLFDSLLPSQVFPENQMIDFRNKSTAVDFLSCETLGVLPPSPSSR